MTVTRSENIFILRTEKTLKNKININISKDTPTEMIAAFYDVLKKSEKTKPKQPLYALNEDIEKLHERYEQLFKQVKSSLNLSANQIEKECETLSRKYDFDLEELSKIGKIEYDKRQAAIKAKAAEETPWRRGWWWRLLLFFPLTNRAQDIIEERAALEADIGFTAEEKQLESESKKLPQDNEQKPSVHKLKRIMRKELKKIIERADNVDVQEAFTEPSTALATSENVEPKALAPVQIQQSAPAAQLPGQMRIGDVQALTPAQPARRPRPPRSCRKP